MTISHPASAADRYDQHVRSFEATIRHKVIEQGDATYKSPLWHEIQAEIDMLTAEKRRLEQAERTTTPATCRWRSTASPGQLPTFFLAWFTG